MAEEWDLWYPQAAATGLPFARGRLDSAAVLLVHAAPPTITVTVRDSEGAVVAHSADLARTAESPIMRLRRDGERISREDIWPADADCGTPVLLPGGEVGILVSWWNSDDRREWRWRIELYNHR